MDGKERLEIVEQTEQVELASAERPTVPGWRRLLGRLGLAAAVSLGAATVEVAVPNTLEPAVAIETGGYPHADAYAYNASQYDWRVDENGDGDYTDGAPIYEWYSPRMYNYRNCTDYVAWKLESLGVPASLTRGRGNGANWDDNANGVTITKTPEVGDAAVWNSVAGGYGHVAFVEEVRTTSSGLEARVSEYNQQGTGMYRGDRWVQADDYVDFNGVGKPLGGQAVTQRRADDFIIYRDGKWYAKAGPSGNNFINYGVPHGGWEGDIPLVGDFNLDGKDDLVIYRHGQWSVKASPDGANFIGPGPNGIMHGGWAGDIPLTGDIDGNGYDDFIIYRSSQGRWITKSGPTGSAFISDVVHGGHAGDVPLVGDINGDHKDDLVIYRPSNGLWGVKAGPSGNDYIGYGVNGYLHGGWPGDVPLLGDFNADGKDEFVIYRPSTGGWHVRASSPDSKFAPIDVVHGGWQGDIPFVGDIDGNGIDDFIIYRSSQGRWITKSGPTGTAFISDIPHGGWNGDVPIIGNIG